LCLSLPTSDLLDILTGSHAGVWVEEIVLLVALEVVVVLGATGEVSAIKGSWSST